LLRIRAEKRKAEIGFEWQKRKQEEHDRRQEQHKMKKDIHQWVVTLAEDKVYHQQTLTERLEQLAEEKMIRAEG
jgi:G3E family GTPase